MCTSKFDYNYKQILQDMEFAIKFFRNLLRHFLFMTLIQYWIIKFLYYNLFPFISTLLFFKGTLPFFIRYKADVLWLWRQEQDSLVSASSVEARLLCVDKERQSSFGCPCAFLIFMKLLRLFFFFSYVSHTFFNILLVFF